MNAQNTKRIHRVTALIFLAAIVFYLFFQANKSSPFVEVNPFAVDPYDAVGSIAIQVALLISLLSYARVLRQRDDPAQAKERLILHGNILIIELGGMFIFTILCGLMLWRVFKGLSTSAPPTNLTPADTIDDLWSLVRVPVVKGAAIFPSPVVEWVNHMNSDRLFTHLQWLDPRKHSWRITGAVGLMVGILLILAKLQEGWPPSLGIGLVVMGIFISVEFVATMLGFALFGGYLGLRPTYKKNY